MGGKTYSYEGADVTIGGKRVTSLGRVTYRERESERVLITSRAEAIRLFGLAGSVAWDRCAKSVDFSGCMPVDVFPVLGLAKRD